ncbi:unnamed protein product [Musa acuminata subsp. burmannicoides]
MFLSYVIMLNLHMHNYSVLIRFFMDLILPKGISVCKIARPTSNISSSEHTNVKY